MAAPMKRRDAREAAIQFLFHNDLSGGEGMKELEAFWNLRPASESVQKFALPLIEGTLQHLADIDARIARCVDNYQINRIAAVDRNILRLAIYEMFHREDIPPVVSINEAIELAKRFGSEDSGRFVNGVLDRVKTELTRPLRTAK